MRTIIVFILALFIILPNCHAQESELTGVFYGSRKGASYKLQCAVHENGLYTLSGIVSYPSNNLGGFRPSDSHYAYGGQRKGNSIRFTGKSYGNPKIEDIPSPKDAKTICELYYEKNIREILFH